MRVSNRESVSGSLKTSDRTPAGHKPAARGPRPSALQTEGLVVGGITPLTTIDMPGELAAVVYCQGCPWRCRYCHNGHLLGRDAPEGLTWPTVRDFLRRRRGLLDGVVFSGGEPTLHRGLASAIAGVRALDFKVGLHTAGCYPQRLKALLPSVDWVGLDIKALPEDYPTLTGTPGSAERAFESLALLLASKVEHEVRVTVHPDWLPQDKLDRLIALLRREGAEHIVLQRCRVEHALDPGLVSHPVDWGKTERRHAP